MTILLPVALNFNLLPLHSHMAGICGRELPVAVSANIATVTFMAAGFELSMVPDLPVLLVVALFQGTNSRINHIVRHLGRMCGSEQVDGIRVIF
jgi:hypothetical protein